MPRFVKAASIDREMILQLARHHRGADYHTEEEGAVGGFGSHVAHLLAEGWGVDTGLKYRLECVLPDIFHRPVQPPEDMYCRGQG